MKRRKSGWALCLAVVEVLAAHAVRASDGVIEINASRAAAGGVTPADTPGFPITISETGSYRLTSNLAQPDPNTSVILIQAEGVTIDLGGFAITGSVSCPGQPNPCVPSTGTGRAIQTTARRTTVRNGSVIGTAGGIVLGESCNVHHVQVAETAVTPLSCLGSSLLQDVSVTRTGATGISVTGGVIERCTVSLNAGNGVNMTGNGATLHDCAASQNAMSGIVSSAPGTVTGSTANDNTLDGMRLAPMSTVTGSTAFNNGEDGIHVGAGVTVTGCTAGSNGGDGFELGSQSTLTGSTAIVNTGFGLNAAADVGYGGNVFSGNNAGAETQVGQASGTTSFQLGTNVCQGDTTCP